MNCLYWWTWCETHWHVTNEQHLQLLKKYFSLINCSDDVVQSGSQLVKHLIFSCKVTYFTNSLIVFYTMKEFWTFPMWRKSPTYLQSPAILNILDQPVAPVWNTVPGLWEGCRVSWALLTLCLHPFLSWSGIWRHQRGTVEIKTNSNIYGVWVV